MNNLPNQSNQNDFDDPVARLLRQSSIHEQHRVTGSKDFAAQIQSIIANKVNQTELKPTRSNREYKNVRRTSLHRVVHACAAIALVAVTFSVLVPFLMREGSAKTDINLAKNEKQYSESLHVRPITKEEADYGLELLNGGLGQTFQSVDSSRQMLRKLLAPLQKSTSKNLSKRVLTKTKTNLANEQKDQFVASFAARVLGH